MKKIVGAIIIVLLVWFGARRINWGKITWVPAEMITVVGEAKSQEKNQIASFTAGINTVNDKKEVAVKEVNDKVAAIIEAVKKFGVSVDDIKTQNMSIYQSEESYWDNGVQKTRKGQWRVDNSIEITLREVDQAAKLADLLTSSGANNVWGPNLRLDDTSQAEKELFDGAMKDALEKAEIIARAAGRKLGKVISVTEGTGVSNFPMYKAEGGMGGGAAIEPGSSTVSKSLTVVFEIK